MRNGVTSKTIRERHQYFIENYPKDNIRLIDDRVEQIMNYIDIVLPRYQNFMLVRNMQKKSNGAVTRNAELAKYPTLLKGLLSKHFEIIMKNYVTNKTEHILKKQLASVIEEPSEGSRRYNDY